MNFYVGQKVVCVDDSDQDDLGDYVFKGAVYVVRGTEFRDQLGLFLVGLSAGPYPTDEAERSFKASRFRPLEELKAESKERYYREHTIA